MNNSLAFPCQHGQGFCKNTDRGLTKREYFAALVMQGILTAHYIIPEDDSIPSATNEQLAQICIQHSDALIKELDKNGSRT